MGLAEIMALALLLVVGGYIFTVGILPEIFAWLGGRIAALLAHDDSNAQTPTVG